MPVTLTYFGQIRQAAGAESETLAVPAGATVAAAVAAAVARHGADFRALLVDDRGTPRPGLLFLVNGVPPSSPGAPLPDGAQLAVFSPVAGG